MREHVRVNDLEHRPSLPERARTGWDALRSNFGFLSGVAMLVGVVAGLALPELDATWDVEPPIVRLQDPEAARSLLETLATATVSVAGLSFSVTLVAFTLASQQLSPLVLRTFRGDRLSQATLAGFLGTFVYAVAVLVRLGSAEPQEPVPGASMVVACLSGLAAFGLFAAFIAHIVHMLQPSSLIDDVHAAGRRAIELPYPATVGEPPSDPDAARRAVEARCAQEPAVPVPATSEGYLSAIHATEVVAAASACDALVVQRMPIGDYVTPGTPLADLRCAAEHHDELAATIRRAFVLRSQRTAVQDRAFPVRQLVDIALKGLSPGINDPTTAQNAVEALAALLVRAAGADRPSPLRADEDGTVRLVTQAPDLDDLVRLGFEQVRIFAGPHQQLSCRLIVLLARIDEAARNAGRPCEEARRQARLVPESLDRETLTDADVETVRDAYARVWGGR